MGASIACSAKKFDSREGLLCGRLRPNHRPAMELHVDSSTRSLPRRTRREDGAHQTWDP